jgi:pimeloyl-ACP methyl ester carboxylesterase
MTADPRVHKFAGPDGVELAWRETGAGRPLVLLHGLMAGGAHLLGGELVSALAASGHRVILPDLRGHGDSGRPHDPARYPPDVLADDGLALIDHLGLDDYDSAGYDLGGYSMGGKLGLRLLARGARPARAFVGGQGLDALDAESDRTAGYRALLAAMAGGAAFAPGSQEARFAQWTRQIDADPVAIGHVLTTFVATPREALAQVPTPVLVVVGDRDSRGATAAELAAALPNGRLVRVPGDHGTALTAPELTAAITSFLA